MKIILLAGTCAHPENEVPVSLQLREEKIWLDHIIEKLLPLRYEIEIVIGKYYGDEILRESKLASKCDIIFDPNEDEIGKFSNFKSALHAVNTSAILFPVSEALPEYQVWQKIAFKLQNSKYGEFDLVRPYCPVAGQMQGGFPLGVTRSCREKVLKNSTVQNLSHEALIEYKLPVLDLQVVRPNATTRQNFPLPA